MLSDTNGGRISTEVLKKFTYVINSLMFKANARQYLDKLFEPVTDLRLELLYLPVAVCTLFHEKWVKNRQSEVEE